MVSKNKKTEAIALINKDNLEFDQYTVSLIKEGYRAGRMDKQTIDSIQVQVMEILTELIKKYTRGESTSVRIETAEKMLYSIYYAIDAAIRSYPDPEDSLSTLKNSSLKDIYLKGLDLVNTCCEETKDLFSKIVEDKIKVSLFEYNDTIDKGIPDFFKKYDPVYNAHDTTADIDYQLFRDIRNVTGIYYIHAYLINLNTETQFCRFFREKDMEAVLQNYGRVYRVDYRSSLLNLFEIILNNSVFAVLSGDHAAEIRVSPFQFDLIKRKLKNAETSEIVRFVDDAFQMIMAHFNIDSTEVINYLDDYKKSFNLRLMAALEADSLDRLIIIESGKNTSSDIILEKGTKIEDDQFRMIFEKIRACKSTTDKINIFRTAIHSLEDYIDMLEADCFFYNEFFNVFNELSDMELAVLGSVVFIEHLRITDLEFSSLNIEENNTEKEWKRAYLQYIQELDPKRKKMIENHINHFE